MKSSVSIKIAVLTPVVLSTWFVTSKIMGRPASAADRPAARPAVPTLTTGFGNEAKPQAIRSGKYANARMLSSSWLVDRSFRVQGDEVQVTASVNLMNTKDDTAYLWRLRVHQESDRVVVMDRPYAEQTFSIHPSGQMNPKFADVIQLPPGRHRVTLSLYGVPKDYDLTELNDDGKALAASLIQATEVVEIQ